MRKNGVVNVKETVLTRVYSLPEAAKLYGVTPFCIRYHIDRGNLTFRQIEGGVYLIDGDSLNRLSQRLHKKTINGLPSDYICFEVF